MKNLLQFIMQHSCLFLFILLEVVAFLLITSNQAYSRSTILTASNQVVAGVNAMGDNMLSYFRLRKDNEQLNEQISRLQAQVQFLQNTQEQLEEQKDTTTYRYAHLSYQFIPAKVIDLTTNQEHNYLTLNKGARDGVEVGMGVVCNQGVVGVVSRVNERFALVVPLIHTGINSSARIKKNRQIGFTSWKGHNYRHINLAEIGRHIAVEEGDSVVTSGMTTTFPEGVMIGVVEKVRLNEGDNYYDIRMRLATDFRKLRYVQVLRNTAKKEMEELLSDE